MGNGINETTLVLASKIPYGIINNAIGHFSRLKRKSAHSKHFGKGSTIRRRNTKKETHFGHCTSMLEFWYSLKDIKGMIDMYEVNDDKNNIHNAKELFKAKTGFYPNELPNGLWVMRKY